MLCEKEGEGGGEGCGNKISLGILDLLHSALKLRIGSFSHGGISRIP